MVALGIDWGEAQVALGAEVRRVTELLRSVRHPGAPAVGEWSLSELAMHLSQVWIAVPALARSDLAPVFELLPGRAGRAGESLIADIADLDRLTVEAVQADPERDPWVLADRIETRARDFFALCAGRPADEPHPWLVQGVTASLSMLTCHLLNETVMHGADIAAADGRPWPVDARHAAMVLLGFLVPALGSLDPRAMVDPVRSAGMHASYDVRLRGGGGFRLVLDDGALRVEPPSSRPADCRLLADPAALLRVLWGRESQWRAVATGKLVAWGRRPWLAPKLRSVIRNP